MSITVRCASVAVLTQKPSKATRRASLSLVLSYEVDALLEGRLERHRADREGCADHMADCRGMRS